MDKYGYLRPTGGRTLMRFLRLLVAAGCVSLLSARSYALSSSWPADDITNPDGRLDVAVGGDIEHLTDVASDGYYGVLIGWENAADDRVYAQRIDPTGAERWTGMVKWTDVDWSAVESAAWLTAGTLAGTIDPASADGIVVTVDPVSLGTVGPQTGIIEISDDAAGMRTAVLAAVVYIYSGAPETDALEFVPGRVEFETLSGSTTACSGLWSKSYWTAGS